MWLLVVLSALYWLTAAVRSSRTRARVPMLHALDAPEPAAWPRVTIVVPARDEGAHIHAALQAKLADGYPALTLRLVDDRSTDDTGARARALGDHRVEVTRVDALTEGWLGKVHALQRGVEASDSEWLLFSDADVHLAPGTLRTLVAWAEAQGLDFVAALPSIHAGDAGAKLALQAFFRLIVSMAPLGAVSDPRSRAAAGVGAFNLVRRDALLASPGLEWLKMEIADDMGLGLMMKRSGARCAVVAAPGAVSLEFYPSLSAMTRALEKNGAQAPAPAMLGGVVVLLALELGYCAGLASAWPWVQALALGTFVLAGLTDLRVARWLRMPRWVAALPGVGTLPLAYAVARSCLLALRRGGVVWRGTFYPTPMVRAGQRVRRGASRPIRRPAA
ncbi:MAG: glycosyltransferase [Myxococcales bacterium]|nr:glycosyltransferase [Myxococcales bacterium]